VGTRLACWDEAPPLRLAILHTPGCVVRYSHNHTPRCMERETLNLGASVENGVPSPLSRALGGVDKNWTCPPGVSRERPVDNRGATL